MNRLNKWLFKPLAFAVIAGAVSVAQAQTVEQPYGKLKKQIEIMSNIIEASLIEEKGRKRSAVRVDGIYLKSQGIVFEINAANSFAHMFRKHGHDFDFDIDFEGMAVPVPPDAPRHFDSGSFSDSIDEVVDRSMQIYEEAMEAMRGRSDHVRELREEQRELSREMRDYARKQRDLEFETRHADEAQNKALEKELAQLKAEAGQLEKKKQALAARAKEEEEALRVKQNKNAEQARQMRQHYYSKLEQTISETLCDYGAGLRLLGKNEQVTFIIDMAHSTASGKVKKVHSFNKKDIASCVKENKTPADLLKASNAYYF